jgi:putative transcriptional regulator
MSKLGKRLVQSAREARLIAQGKAEQGSYRLHVPAQVDVRKIRQMLNLSQAEFSNRFGVTLTTLRDWEQVLMLVIQNDPEAVTRALTPRRRLQSANHDMASA